MPRYKDPYERYLEESQPMSWGKFLLITIALVVAVLIFGGVFNALVDVGPGCDCACECRKQDRLPFDTCMMDCIEAGEAAQEPLGPFDW